MTPTPLESNKLREEWRIHSLLSSTHFDTERIADWWLEKITLAKKEKGKEIARDIHNLGYTEYVSNNNPLLFHPRAIQLERIENYFKSKELTTN